MDKPRYIRREFDFTLEQLYGCGGIEGMNDLCQMAYENEEGEKAGILGSLDFRLVSVDDEQGLIRIAVAATVDYSDDNESDLSSGHMNDVRFGGTLDETGE